ncbi:MAG: helix-turn-helix transcriptional regulator [Burkholderiales bacterium]|nr:helix-turn-helix transcriptional regulator [Burkholderiales bacterium]
MRRAAYAGDGGAASERVAGRATSRIVIKPAWVLSSDAGDHFEPQLFRLLRAIHDHGKLTVAARAVGLSYRHAWDLLGRWNAIFGSELVLLARGRGARLSALGEKLLWAEQRTEAGLFPQLENVANELNAAIRHARAQTASVLRIHASHGYAIEKIPDLTRDHGEVDVDLKYMSSVDAVASLARGDCDLAGFHVPEGELGPVLWEQYAPFFKPRQQKIVRMVWRAQGLIVAKGNPRKIRALRDLTRPGIRFVNRQPGSGTRVLLDSLLAAQRVDATRIVGYDTGEFTHAAVAAFVASGMADVGMAIEPAAAQFGLDFVPVVRERYMLTGRGATLATPAVVALCSLLRGAEFARLMAPVAGYEPDHPGEIVAAGELFAWVAKK